MFGKIRYFRGVNRCIAEIGVDRGRVHPAFRREIKNVGYWYKNTPEECATAVLYHIAVTQRPEGYDVVLSDWIDRGLVRRSVLQSIVHNA